MANLHTFTKIVNSNISLKLCHSQMDHFIILIFCVILFQLQIGYINGYGQVKYIFFLVIMYSFNLVFDISLL